MNETYTVKQVAQILGYSTNSIYTFLKEKRIKGVRVGKGRFRIPASELARLLKTEKQLLTPTPLQQDIPSLPAQQLPIQTTIEKPSMYIASLRNIFSNVMPQIFDWYISTSSIITGASLFFINHQSLYQNPFLSGLTSTIRIALISLGMSMFIMNFFQPGRSLASKILRMLLSVIYGLFFVICIMQGAWLQAVVLASSIIILVITLITDISSVASFLIYSLALLFVTPFIASIHAIVQNNTMIWGISPYTALAIWTAYIALLSLGCFSLPIYTSWSTQLFVPMISISHSILSYWLGTELSWTIASSHALLAAYTMVTQQWDASASSVQKTRRSIILSYIGIVCTFLIALFIMHLQQEITVSSKKEALANTTGYHALLVENALHDTSSALESLSQNQTIRESIAKKEIPLLEGTARSFFEVNRLISLVTYYDASASALVTYPTTSESLPLSSHTMKKVQESNGVFINDPEIIRDQFMIRIIAPVRGEKQTIQGYISSIIQVSSIGDLLQQSNAYHENEKTLITTIDGKNMLIPGVSPNPSLISDIPQNLAGTYIRYGVDESGQTTIRSSAKIQHMPFFITTSVPITSVIPQFMMTMILIVSTIMISIVSFGIKIFRMMDRKVSLPDVSGG